MQEKTGVQENPKQSKSDRCDNKFPAAAKLRDLVRRAIGECHTQGFFLIYVARDAVPQKFVGAPQPQSESRKQLDCHTRLPPHKPKKIIPGYLPQPHLLAPI